MAIVEAQHWRALRVSETHRACPWVTANPSAGRLQLSKQVCATTQQKAALGPDLGDTACQPSSSTDQNYKLGGFHTRKR